MKEQKKREELEVDLMEVQAYRELQDERFEGMCGDVGEINKEVSNDAMYEIEEEQLRRELEYANKNKEEKKQKEPLNRYARKFRGQK